MWLGNRLERMDAGRPRKALLPHELVRYGGDQEWDAGEIEAWQLDAFEADVERWWLVLPPPEDAADPDAWHYAEVEG